MFYKVRDRKSNDPALLNIIPHQDKEMVPFIITSSRSVNISILSSFMIVIKILGMVISFLPSAGMKSWWKCESRVTYLTDNQNKFQRDLNKNNHEAQPTTIFPQTRTRNEPVKVQFHCIRPWTRKIGSFPPAGPVFPIPWFLKYYSCFRPRPEN